MCRQPSRAGSAGLLSSRVGAPGLRLRSRALGVEAGRRRHGSCASASRPTARRAGQGGGQAVPPAWARGLPRALRSSCPLGARRGVPGSAGASWGAPGPTAASRQSARPCQGTLRSACRAGQAQRIRMPRRARAGAPSKAGARGLHCCTPPEPGAVSGVAGRMPVCGHRELRRAYCAALLRQLRNAYTWHTQQDLASASRAAASQRRCAGTLLAQACTPSIGVGAERAWGLGRGVRSAASAWRGAAAGAVACALRPCWHPAVSQWSRRDGACSLPGCALRAQLAECGCKGWAW